METRELRYFVAVAEELHVSRAAERLGIAQPPLSRAVAQLERRLGVQLLVRSNRGVGLTPAGAVLLDEARAVLTAVEAAERRTRRAAAAPDGRAPVVLASKAGAAEELVAKLLDRHAAAPGAVAVEVLLCGPAEQARALRDGRADVALLHLPFDDATGLDTEVLTTEEQVVLLPAGHPAAAREHLTRAELDELARGDLPAPRFPAADGSVPDGPGPAVRDTAQLLQLVGLGRTHLVAPASARPAPAGPWSAYPSAARRP